jgi:glycosyltransferase involved in cell wall biosynthesis
VYNVQEIYPDILKLKGGFVLKFLRWMEHKVYNGSDAVTTIDKVFYDTIEPRFENKSKLHIIPNFVDTELYREVPFKFSNTDDTNLTDNNATFKDTKLYTLDSKLFPNTDSIKLLYAGNIGHMQSWEPLVVLADKTRDMNVEYFVIGEGAQRGYVEEEIKKRGLDKLHLLPYQPRELMPAILSYSDASFIFMVPGRDGDGFPSKVYTIMACERPMLIMSGENTSIINFLKGKNCAKLITEKDFDKKVEEMVDWLKTVTKEELAQMGKNGLAEIKSKYTKEIVTSLYSDLVKDLIGE